MENNSAGQSFGENGKAAVTLKSQNLMWADLAAKARTYSEAAWASSYPGLVRKTEEVASRPMTKA